VKLRCERDVLLEVLSVTGRAAAGRGSSLPVLAGVRLEVAGDHLSAVGTDLDLTISASVEVSGLSDGVVVAPGRLLTDIVRALDPGAVSLDAGEDDDLRVSAGRSQFSVRTHPVADFPRLPPPTGETVTVPALGLAEALRQVVRAASGEEARPVLTGVLMAAEAGGLRLVATDSYRLAVRDVDGVGVLGTDQSVLVPSRALSELGRLLSDAGEVAFRFGQHDATFSTGSVAVTTRLIEGEFPNYRQLIPSSYPNRLVVGRAALLEAVRRVKLLARDPLTPVRIALQPGDIELSVITPDWGTASEEVPAAYEGAEMTVAFNPAYLLDGVDAIAGDEVVLSTVDALRPATLRPTGSEDYLYLLMPVRVP
jgi:DNA polymerase-3 subunit beta